MTPKVKKLLKAAAQSLLAFLACFAIVSMWMVLNALLDSEIPPHQPKQQKVVV